MSQHANDLTVPILPDDERQQVPKTPIAKATPCKVWYLLMCAILLVFGILAILGLVERAIRSRAIINDYDYFLEPLDDRDFDDYVVDDSILVNDMNDDGDDDASIAAFKTYSFQESGTLVPMLEKAGALPSAKTESESSESSDEEIPAETESCDLSSEDCWRQLIKKYPVLIFLTEWCPWSKRLLELLDWTGIPRESIHIIDLDDYKSTLDICANMKTITGQKGCQIPNLFVGGEWIGGYTKAKELYELGRLEPKFRKAGVLPSAKTESESSESSDEKTTMVPTRLPWETESESSESSDEEIPAETESCDLSSEDCVRQLIKKYPVLLFSWRLGSERLLELLDWTGIPRESIHIIYLDDYKSIMSDICANMKTLTGQKGCQIPNLFVGGEWIGGYTKAKELYDLEELEPIFRKAGVLSQS